MYYFQFKIQYFKADNSALVLDNWISPRNLARSDEDSENNDDDNVVDNNDYADLSSYDDDHEGGEDGDGDDDGDSRDGSSYVARVLSFPGSQQCPSESEVSKSLQNHLHKCQNVKCQTSGQQTLSSL